MHARMLGSALLCGVCLMLAGCQLFQPTSTKTKPGADDPAREKQGAMVASAEKPQPIVTPPQAPAASEESAPLDPSVQAYLDAFNKNAAREKEALVPQVSGVQAQRPPADALSQISATAPATEFEDFPRGPVAVPLGPNFADAGDRRDSDDSEASDDEDARELSPRVGRVSVRAASDTESFERSPRDSRLRANQPLESARMPTSLKGFLDEFVRDSSTGTFRQQLDERILRVLVGDDAAAQRPMSLVSAEQQKLADSILASLVSVREAHLGDPSMIEDSAVRALQQLRDTLRSLEQLSIPALAVCWKVDGFGNYQQFDPPNFVAGRENELIVYTEIDGFLSEQRKDDWFYANFELTTTVHDRIGNTVATFNEPDIIDKCRTRRVDCFVPHLIRLPASLSPGDYVVKVTVVDKLADRVAQNRVQIKLVTSLARG